MLLALGRKLTDQERADRQMSEAAFQRRVLYRAKKAGWRHVHVSPAMVGGEGDTVFITPTAKGFPDLILVKAGRQPIFAELKKELGHLTQDQWDWLDLLIAAGQCAVVWRPSDLPQIEEVLRG